VIPSVSGTEGIIPGIARGSGTLAAMRYQRDGSWQRFDRVVLAGSPLKVFRTTEAGALVVDALEAGADVAQSTLIDRLVEAGAIHPVHDPHAPHRFGIDDVTVVTPQLGGLIADDGRITVDDGSQPPIAGATIRLGENCGPAAARNVGRAVVSTPLVAFVDADVDLLDDIGGQCWLANLLPHFDDPQVGLVAPRVAGEVGSPLDLGDEPARIRAGTRVSYVPGAAVVVRADAFDDVGGFDAALRYGEDVDFAWRLDATGWRCRYEPASTVWHEPRPTVTGRLRQQVGYGTSAAPLALRHPRKLSPLRTNGWTASAWGLAGAGHPLAAAGLAVGSALALIPKLDGVPPRVSFRLAMSGHVLAIRQFASALRRVWWPLLALGALVSKRCRVVAVAAVAIDAPATLNDVAYGWGVWKGMRAHRCWGPIIPALVKWPPRRVESRRGQTPA
jgi:mycofactocin system glycosyltransferase